MGPYRTPAEDTPRRETPKLTLDDAGLPLLVAGLSAPVVIAALAAGITWGVGESIAAAALSLALANLGARVHRRIRGGHMTASAATTSPSAPVTDDDSCAPLDPMI